MNSERVEKTLEELAAPTGKPFSMGPFGSRIRSENYRPFGVPVIRGVNLGDVGGAAFIDSDFVFLSEEKADELSSSAALPGDVVFVAQGTVGRVGLVPKRGAHKRFVLSQNLMKATLDPRAADPKFVFYYFRTPDGQQEILSRVNPTGVPCISQPLSSLRQFRVLVPSLPEQQAIAGILGALDDKIELNRRTNKTLEAMARAIFKSWFVDFDPARAKAAGQQPPGLAPHIAALFPDSFEASELGEVPRGWKTGQVGRFVREVRYGVAPGDIAAATPYIALQHMPRRSIDLSDWGAAEGIASGKLRFDRGDILFGKLRPYFHKPDLCTQPASRESVALG